MTAPARNLRRAPGAELAAVLLLLGFFVVNGLIAARTHTPTVDEFVYLPAGYYHLRTGDLTFDASNPPLLKMAMALPLLAMDLELERDPYWRDNSTGWGPWIFGTRFMELNRAAYLDAFFAARLVTIMFGIVTGALLWWWARTLLSPVAALAALLLYATSPTVLAHSALATLDIGVTMLILAAFGALARFSASHRRRWAVIAGALFGLGVASKGVALIFAPLVPFLTATGWRAWDRDGTLRFAGGIMVLGASAWLALLTVYQFSGFPLPGPVLEGIRFQAIASSAGEFPAFLNGEWSQTGWWYYFVEALVLKTPLPTIAFVLVGLAAIVRRRGRAAGDLWIVLPPLFLLYVLSFHFGKNYGVRYLLPALPFLMLLAGVGVQALLRARRAVPVVAALVLWQVVASVFTAPHHLAYFNELAGAKDEHRRLLLDSNLDWGQDLGRLKAFLDEGETGPILLGYFGHVDPALYGIDYTLPPDAPAPGRYAVSANFLAGYPYAITYREPMLGVRPGAWSWIDRVRPIARVGSSIYVFDVSEDDARRLATRPDAEEH